MLKLSRSRASSAVALAALALAAGGCVHTQSVPSGTTTTVSHESAAIQVTHTCIDNIFDNGLLPLQAAQQECVQCVQQALSQLGFKQAAHQSADALIATVRLDATQSSELNNACDQTDAAD